MHVQAFLCWFMVFVLFHAFPCFCFWVDSADRPSNTTRTRQGAEKKSQTSLTSFQEDTIQSGRQPSPHGSDFSCFSVLFMLVRAFSCFRLCGVGSSVSRPNTARTNDESEEICNCFEPDKLSSQHRQPDRSRRSHVHSFPCFSIRFHDFVLFGSSCCFCVLLCAFACFCLVGVGSLTLVATQRERVSGSRKIVQRARVSNVVNGKRSNQVAHLAPMPALFHAFPCFCLLGRLAWLSSPQYFDLSESRKSQRDLARKSPKSTSFRQIANSSPYVCSRLFMLNYSLSSPFNDDFVSWY